MLRLFFALQPTPGQSAALLSQISQLGAAVHAQPVPASNVHATVCFIGAVAPARLDALRAAAAEVRAPAIRLRFDTLEYWARPRVLCATAPGPCDAAQEFSRALADCAEAAGFAPDRSHPFRPHLTLARKVRAASARALPWPIPLAPAVELRCERFALMESRRGDAGSIYSALETWALDGDEPLPKPSE